MVGRYRSAAEKVIQLDTLISRLYTRRIELLVLRLGFWLLG